jgi:hypothetical protein
VTDGMAEIRIEGRILGKNQQKLENDDKESLSQGNLDGCYKGFPWLSKHRGYLKAERTVIANNLYPQPHSVIMKIENTSYSEDGTFKSDSLPWHAKDGRPKW